MKLEYFFQKVTGISWSCYLSVTLSKMLSLTCFINVGVCFAKFGDFRKIQSKPILKSGSVLEN